MKIALNKMLLFGACVLSVLAVGGVSGWLGSSAINTWYTTLNKPNWNPPNQLFGPVWTVLYILMGIGLFIVVKSKSSIYRQNAIAIFCIQLVLNFFWSLMFFRWQMMGLALVNIIILLLMITVMIFAFKKVDTTAAVLQIPYALWVAFATILNGTLWYMNS